MKVKNKIYNIKSGFNKEIILISDLHYDSKTDIERLNFILENIKETDFICIPGDIMNKSKILDEDLLISWLEKLSKKGKVIMCIGNHEFYLDKPNKKYELNINLFNKIKKINNLYLLNNENITIDDINFIGITIPIEYYDKDIYKDIDKKLSNDKYNILLCHNHKFLYESNMLKNNKIDLALCGHMHGGAVMDILRPLFKQNGFVSPDKKLFPKNIYGQFKLDNTNIIVTSGIRVIPYKAFNFLFKPEIVRINLTK